MEFLPFFLILLTGIFFSAIFRHFHLPWVLALIFSGVLLGPHGFALFEVTPTLSFLSSVGLVFLMFMAGLETKLSSLKGLGKDVGIITFFNALIPAAAGFTIGWWFGFPLLSSLLLGVIFMSSSIAVVIPTLENTGIIHTKLGQVIVSTTMLSDIASLIALSFILQSVDPVTSLPLALFYVLLIATVVAVRFGLPALRQVLEDYTQPEDQFETEVRIIVSILIGVVVIFELIGLHPIVAGFFTGLVLSESITSELLLEKIRTIGYGIFIPTFFVAVGMETDVSVFFSGSQTLWLVLIVVLVSMFSKLVSGYIPSRLLGFSDSDAMAIGVSSIPQLSTSLAVVFAAAELDLLSPEMVAAMVALSATTTLLAPLLLHFEEFQPEEGVGTWLKEKIYQ